MKLYKKNYLVKMKKKIALLIFICLSITGCSYEFSSDNFLEISKPKIEENIIDLNNFKNLDTINVQSQLVYTFKGESNQYLIESKLFIDNQNFGMSTDGNVGTFNINPSTYEDGIHIIRIENKFTSGTGSIADQAQMEILNAIQEFKFIIHRKPSIPPAVTEATIKDGSIVVKWASANNLEYKSAFLSLKFKRNEIRIPLTKEMLELGSYTDKNTILFPANSNTPDYDNYLSVTYSIVLTSPYTELYGSNKTITYDSSWFNMKISYYNNDSYKVKWSAHPLYANFDTFEIRVGINSFMGSSKGGEYIVNTPYVFGKEYDGAVQPVPPIQNYSAPIYSFYNMELDENTFGLFNLNPFYSQDILYNPSTNEYYVLIIEKSSQGVYQIYFYEYSEKMVFIKKTYITNTFLPNSHSLQMILEPITNNIYFDSAGTTYVIDKTNLNIIQKYNNQSNMVTYRNGILKSWNNLTNQLSITNTVTNTIIYSGTATYRSYLSRDGKYIYIATATNQTIYKIINNQLSKVMDVNISSNNYSGFIEIENDTVFYTVNNQVFIVDLNTKATKSLTFGTLDPYLQFDSISQKLLLTQNGYNGIYDLATKQVSLFRSETNKDARGTFSSVDRDYFLRLQNGRLIHSKGIYLDIN
jgi:hypothetical protein